MGWTEEEAVERWNTRTSAPAKEPAGSPDVAALVTDARAFAQNLNLRNTSVGQLLNRMSNALEALSGSTATAAALIAALREDALSRANGLGLPHGHAVEERAADVLETLTETRNKALREAAEVARKHDNGSDDIANTMAHVIAAATEALIDNPSHGMIVERAWAEDLPHWIDSADDPDTAAEVVKAAVEETRAENVFETAHDDRDPDAIDITAESLSKRRASRRAAVRKHTEAGTEGENG